jgi:hypothetical protein
MEKFEKPKNYSREKDNIENRGEFRKFLNEQIFLKNGTKNLKRMYKRNIRNRKKKYQKGQWKKNKI